MCTNGVNTSQFQTNLTQIDEGIALLRRWTHRAFHQAEDSQSPMTAAALHEVQGLLDEARAKLSDANDLIEQESSQIGVTVQLV